MTTGIISLFILILQSVVVMSPKVLNTYIIESEVTAEDAASTERSMRRAWIKCTEAEESNRMLKRLVSARVGTNAIESYSYCGAGRERWRNRGEEGRKQVVVEELQSRVLDSDFKVGKLKTERKKMSNKFKAKVKHNAFEGR